MSKLTTKQRGERIVQIARDAVQLINDMVEQGYNASGIEEALQPCSEAHYALEHLMWRLKSYPERRKYMIQGLRMAADFLENHRDPVGDFEDAYVVEMQAASICSRYEGYFAYEIRNDPNKALSIDGYASYYLQAAGQVEEFIRQGLVLCCETSQKSHREFRHKPIREDETTSLPKAVSTHNWYEPDIARLADVRRAEDEKREAANA